MPVHRSRLLAALAATVFLAVAAPASATNTSGALIDSADCTQTVLPRNDDGSSPSVSLPFSVNFYGITYDHLWVNNNGNVTFDNSLSTYTPFGLIAANRAIIAPFFADADTTGSASQPVTYGYGETTFGGRRAFCVDWIDVGYFSGHTDKLNSFQLLLVDRSDTGEANFDIVFNYGTINWETGDASSGAGGLGGFSARAGYANGDGTATNSFELPGSGINGALLDGAPTALASQSLGSTHPGRDIFQARDGRPVIDTTPPETTLDIPPAALTRDATPHVAFSSNETGSSFECSIDALAFAPCSSPEELATLADGEHTFTVRATDVAGNVDPTPAQASFVVDTTPPTTTFSDKPDALTRDATPTAAFTADDPAATFECALDGAPFTACTSSHTYPTVADGPHAIAVRATDLAGNVETPTALSTFVVDTTPPQTTITDGPSRWLRSRTATFRFAATEDGSSFACSLDGEAFAPCTSPAVLTDLAQTHHAFAVRATDPAGNVDLTAATQDFSVDVTPPVTSITAGPPAAQRTTTATLRFAVDEPGSTLDCSLDGQALATCESPMTLDDLADGEHHFTVRATDPAGNVETDPPVRTFVVDTVAPDTTITAGPTATLRSPAPSPSPPTTRTRASSASSMTATSPAAPARACSTASRPARTRSACAPWTTSAIATPHPPPGRSRSRRPRPRRPRRCR